MSYYYKILLFSLSLPLALSFSNKVKFNQKFKVLSKSISLSSFIFIIWDIIFTYNSLWGFNEKFISGLYIFNLPIEEVLFFFIIPFCCLFTSHILEKYDIIFIRCNNWKIFHQILIFTFFLLALVNFSKMYTFVCFISLSIILFFIKNSKISINYNLFYSNFVLMLIPFLLVNGSLTGSFFNQTVVWYDISEILNIYIFTIPIEDAVYCYQLLLINSIFYNYYNYKINNNS